jgi:hypothetical protein
MNRLEPKLLRDNDRGAVMVESLVAIPTLMAFFAMMVQLSYLSMASLVVQHAAVVSARSASVIIPDIPFAFGDQSKVGTAEGDRHAAVVDAAKAAIASLKSLPTLALQSEDAFNEDVDVQIMKDGKESGEFEPEDIVQTKIQYDFKCSVLFGGSLICGTSGKVTLTSLAAMPVQGAEYGYY